MNKNIIKAIVFFMLCFFIFNCNKKSDNFELFGQNLEAKKLDQVTLTFYVWSKSHPETRNVLDEIEKKSRKELNIKLDFKFIFDFSFYSEVKNLIENNQPCDAFVLTSMNKPRQLYLLHDQDLILDITELFPRYAPNYYGKFNEKQLSFVTIDKKLLAIPTHYYISNRRCVLIREDLCKKYNVKSMKSYDELEEFLNLIAINEPDCIPLSTWDTALGLFAEYFGYVIFDYELSLVYKMDDPEMKLMAWEQTPEYRKAIQMINRWINKGFFLKDNYYARPDMRLVASGKWAAYISSQGTIFQFNRWIYELQKDFRYLEFPLYPDKLSMRSAETNNGLVISKNSKNPERILMFIEWLHKNQKNYDLFMYGIKNKHYQLKDGQYFIPAGTKISKSYSERWWRNIFLDFDFDRTHIANSRIYKQDMIEHIIKNTEYPPHTGFRANYYDVLGIANVRRMNFWKIEWEMGRGKYSDKRIDEYINSHKESGADKLVAAAQQQLDEWKSEIKN